jgi:hypothetical protein
MLGFTGRTVMGMFTKHSVYIEQPVVVCTEALLGGPPKWFLDLRGKKTSKVGLHIAGIPVRKRVELEVGEAVRTATWTVIPLSWKATFPQQLFPMMTGKIELAPVDKNVTRLTVSGMYDPPLGHVGRQLDEALMHKVAEGTVHELAESIAERLADWATAPQRV